MDTEETYARAEGSRPTLPPCARAFAGVRQKQERQGRYPAAFVYGSPCWTHIELFGWGRGVKLRRH